MLNSHQANILEHHIAPHGVSRMLVTGVALRIGLEEGLAIGGEGHPTAFREFIEISSIGGLDVNASVFDPYGLSGKSNDSLNEIFLAVISLHIAAVQDNDIASLE